MFNLKSLVHSLNKSSILGHVLNNAQYLIYRNNLIQTDIQPVFSVFSSDEKEITTDIANQTVPFSHSGCFFSLFTRRFNISKSYLHLGACNSTEFLTVKLICVLNSFRNISETQIFFFEGYVQSLDFKSKTCFQKQEKEHQRHPLEIVNYLLAS